MKNAPSSYNAYAQAMSTALSVWVTTSGLGWNTSPTGPTLYKFQQGFGGVGLGDLYYNVGTNGASFGVADNAYAKVSYLLTYLNNHYQGTGGSFVSLPTFTFINGYNTTLLSGALVVFGNINNTGNI